MAKILLLDTAILRVYYSFGRYIKKCVNSVSSLFANESETRVISFLPTIPPVSLIFKRVMLFLIPLIVKSATVSNIYIYLIFRIT